MASTQVCTKSPPCLTSRSHLHDTASTTCLNSTLRQSESPDPPRISSSRVLLHVPSLCTNHDYFCHCYYGSVRWNESGTSISGNVLSPTLLSPRHIPKESNKFPTLTQTLNSDGSLDFLAAPPVQDGNDVPPYKPRRADSSCLNMAIMRRANSLPLEKIKILRKFRGRKLCRNRRSRAREYMLHSSWWHGNCWVAATMTGNDNHVYQRRDGKTQGYTEIPPKDAFISPLDLGASESITACPTAKQCNCPSIDTDETQSNSKRSHKNDRLKDSQSILDQPHHGSLKNCNGKPNPGLGASGLEAIQAIRTALTTRPVNSPQLPDLITLRRSSSVEDLSRSATDRKQKLTHSSNLVARPSSVESHSVDSPTQEAYIITMGDVDAITELIRAALSKSHQLSIPVAGTSTFESCQKPPVVKFTDGGLVLGAGTISETIITRTGVQNCSNGGKDPLNFLGVVSEMRSGLSSNSPEKSIHEVIWEGNRELDSQNSSSSQEISPKPRRRTESLEEQILEPSGPEFAMGSSGSCFGPDNLNSAQNQSQLDTRLAEREIRWNSANEETEDASIGTSSDRPVRPALRSHGAEMKVYQVSRRNVPCADPARNESLQKVLSFPPLPVRNSNDWYSPLPSEDSPALTTYGSLDDVAVDVNCGPQLSNSSGCRAEPCPTSWIRTAEILTQASRASSIAPDPDYEARRTSIRSLAEAIPTIEELLVMDESSYTHESNSKFASEASPDIDRVQTFDNIHKGKHDGTRSRLRSPLFSPTQLTVVSDIAMDGNIRLVEARENANSLEEALDNLDLLYDVNFPYMCPPWLEQDGLGALFSGIRGNEAITPGESSTHTNGNCAIPG